MNGIHDLGGMHGFGPVVPEENEPVFHDRWEQRVFALNLAMAATGAWNIDQGRFAREDRPALDYLKKSYFELWLAGLERLLRERHLAGAEELAAGRALAPAPPLKHRLTAAEVGPSLAAGSSFERPPVTPARFRPGELVRAKALHPTGHTRLPRYVRGHLGRIHQVNGVHVFPDANAKGLGEDPQWLYTVRFEGRELWGEFSDPALAVCLAAWEPYLEPA